MKSKAKVGDVSTDFFGINKRNTSIQIEVLAGISTFLSLSYIFVVNPAILSQTGMDKSFVLFATIVASALATLVMGVWARLPFVLAPGMEMNAYVAFFVVGSLGFTWQQALGAVFWSGVVFIILTVFRVREKIIDAIPPRMKSGLSLSVGVFLGLVALKIAGVLRYEDINIKGFGDFASPLALVFYASLALVLVLDRLRVRAAVLISIILATLFCHLLGIGSDGEQPAELSRAMFAGIGKLDSGVIANPKILSVILILFLVDFYGSIAKFIGLTMNTDIMVNGKLPRIKEALSIDGIATIFGSFLGTTNPTTYVESGVGIGVGGRTGLTSIVCGLLMLSCFFIAPLLKFVPVVATTGVLLFVGIKLCPPLHELKSYTKVDLFVMGIMQITVVATFAIDRAMVYILIDLFARRRPNPYLVGSTVLLAIGAVLQMV
jgi:adenine/guanine/hypoxanthine permease